MTLWKPKPLGAVEDGVYEATITSVKRIGDKKTQYGIKKDWHDFAFRIELPDGEFREVKQGWPLSLDKKANFLKLLVALDISVKDVQRNGIDPDTLVDKGCNVRVFNTRGHSNIIPLSPTPVTAEEVEAANALWRNLPDNLHEDFEWYRTKARRLEMRYEAQQKARYEV